MRKRNILILVIVILGVLFIDTGSILSIFPTDKKEKKDLDVKEFTITADFVTKVGDSLLVSNGTNYAYYDMNGKKILDFISPFDGDNYMDKVDAKDGMFVVTDDMIKYGVVDSKGKLIIPKEYIAVKILSKKCYLVKTDAGVWNVLNAQGERILDSSINDVRIVDDLGAIISINGKFKIIDVNGNIILNKEYVDVIDDLSNIDFTVPIVIGNDGTNLIDIYLLNKERIVVLKKIVNNYSIDDNYIYYSKDGDKFSVYEFKTGKVKNNVEYDFSSNGMLTFIGDNGLLGYKSSDGKTTIPAQYQASLSENFTKYGVAIVGSNNLLGIINKSGEMILPSLYERIIVFSDKLFGVSEDNQVYYGVNDKGEKVFERIEFEEKVRNTVIVDSNDKCGIIDSSGKIIFDFKYDNCILYKDFVIAQSNTSWNIRKTA